MLIVPRNALAGIVVAGSALGLTLAMAAGSPSVFRALHQVWTQVYAAFAHGYLVLALAIWLGARRWRSAPPSVVQPYWLAAIPTLALGCMITMLDSLGLGATRLVLLPALLTCAIWWVLGSQVARIVVLPAGLLHFALPPWAILDRPLQWLTTKVVNAAVNLTGIPAYVEGNQFHLPAGTFEIALGCSGLNYLVTALALLFFHGAAYLSTWRERTRVLIVAAGTALLANWLRVYLLIVVGHLSDMQHYLVRVEHHYFGWVLFAVMMWPVLRWAVSMEQVNVAADRASLPTNFFPARIALAGAAAASVLVGLRLLSPTPEATSTSLAALPDTVGRWRSDTLGSSLWAPEFKGASTALRQYTADDGAVVFVFRAAYARRTADLRLESSGNDLLGESAFVTQEWPDDLELGGKSLPVIAREVSISDRRMVLWSLKAVGGAPYRSRLQELRATLTSKENRSEAVLVAWATACTEDCAAAHDTARAAIRDMALPMLEFAPRPTHRR